MAFSREALNFFTVAGGNPSKKGAAAEMCGSRDVRPVVNYDSSAKPLTFIVADERIAHF